LVAKGYAFTKALILSEISNKLHHVDTLHLAIIVLSSACIESQVVDVWAAKRNENSSPQGEAMSQF
jgi:hypothetical protein